MFERDQEIDGVRKEIAALREENQRRSLTLELKLASPEQAEKVSALVTSGLNAQEALGVAQSRHAELFGLVSKAGFQAGVHGGLRPTGAGPLAVETLKTKVDKIKTIVNPIDRDAAERRLHGKMVLDLFAQSMGMKSRE
jgi:hypothetical protein